MQLTDKQFEAELRALRATPSEQFSAELDAWAAAGFPRAEQLSRVDDALQAGPAGRGSASRVSRPAAPLRRMLDRPLLPFLAGATTIVLVASVATAVLLEDESDTGPLSGEGGGESRELREDSSPAGAEEAAPGAAGDAAVDQAIEPAPTTIQPSPPVPPDGQLKPGQERVQERSAAMTLSTEPGEVDDVADRVVEVTERYDGIVVSSNVSSNDERGRASFDLRIPTHNLQAALADLSDLASVASRDEGTLDITAPFISAEERFGDAKAEVDALLDRLAEADSATEIASVREQLGIARSELAAARAELGGLKQRAEFSRLSLSVVGDGDADGWSLGDAADDAVNVLEDLAGAGLVAVAVIIPLGALAVLVWLGGRSLRRRLRERALD